MMTLLQRTSLLNADIVESRDLATILSGAYKHTLDLLIVNPSHLGMMSPSQLRSELGNENLKVVALQSSFTDKSMLQGYDDVLSIFDSIDTITEKITLATKDSEGEEVKRELSQREREIIVCVVKGMTNKQIADTLCLSTHTVISHRRNIANKLQIHSPSGLTIYAIVNKLVDLADIKNTISSSSL